MTNAELQKLVEALQVRVEFLESCSPEIKTKIALEKQRKENEAKAAAESAERAKAEEERLIRVSRFNRDFERPDQHKEVCNVCGEGLPSQSLVVHWIHQKLDKCIRFPKRALKLGYINQDQFDMIPADKIDTGFVFEGIGAGEGSIQHEAEHSPAMNPLAGESAAPRPIKHIGTVL